jgi:hypothetical protein
MIQGTFNQIVKKSGTFGGTLVVFEGKPELLVGGFNFTLDDLPAPGVVLPCGTPVNCDESTRKITPLLVAKVASIVADTDSKKLKLVPNGFGEVPFKVGDLVAEINDTLTNEYSNTAAVGSTPASYTFVKVVDVDGDTITLENAIANLAANDIIVQVAENETTHKAAIKAVPNALLPYDVVRDANAISVDGDGMWANDRPILERRMPIVTAAIKTALVNAGCVFKWSNRK